MKNYLFITLVIFIASCKNGGQPATTTADSVRSNSTTAKHNTAATTTQSNADMPPTRLTISVESANVIIDTSATGKVHIVDHTNKKEVTYKETISGDDVEIESKGKNQQPIHPGTIELHVPGDCIIGCDMMSGDLKISHVHCKSVRIELMSGDIGVKDVTIRKGKLSTMSGNVNFSAAVDSGNIELSSMSGNVNVFLNEKSNVKLRLSSQSSSVFFNGDDNGKNSMSKVFGNGLGVLSCKTMSGNASCMLKRADL